MDDHRHPLRSGRWCCRSRLKTPAGGHRRIHGELLGLGYKLAPTTVWLISKRAGIDPAPRRTGPTWTQLLSAQAKTTLTCDFFSVDTVFFRRIYVLRGKTLLTRSAAGGRAVGN